MFEIYCDFKRCFTFAQFFDREGRTQKTPQTGKTERSYNHELYSVITRSIEMFVQFISTVEGVLMVEGVFSILSKQTYLIS